MNTCDTARLAPAAKSAMLGAAGTRRHNVEAGVGRPLLRIDGWPQLVHVWRDMFEPLAACYRMIARMRGISNRSRSNSSN